MEEFIRAFQGFDLDGGDDNADLEALVRKEFPVRFDLPAEQAVLSPTRNLLSLPQRELLDELVQHLTDLDYLSFAFLENYQQKVAQVLPKAIAKKILAALRQYFADDGALRQSELDPEQLDLDDLSSGNDLLTIALERLCHLTSLDGDMSISRSLHIGEQGLLTRVFLYRLRALGQLFDGEKVSDPLNRLHIVRAWNFERWMGERTAGTSEPDDHETLSPEEFALTGNVHRMFRRFCETNPRQVLFYHCPLPDVEVEARHEFLLVFHGKFVSGRNRRQFRRACRQPVKVNGQEVEIKLGSALQLAAERGGNETASRTLSNQFGIHLLQLKMWMFGFYYGRIDGRYGPLSHAAFLDLLEHEKMDKKRKRKRILLALDEGYWAVNLPKAKKLFKNFDRHLSHAEKRENDLLKVVDAQNEAAIFEAQSRHRQMEVHSFFANARRRGRRIYHGVRSAVSVAWQGIGRVVKWLAKKLKKITGAVVSFLKNVFKRIREGVQVFYRAMRRFGIFILRKPLVTPENFRKLPPDSPIVLTRFAYDLDTINIRSSRLSEALGKEHTRVVRNLLYGLSLFLEIAALAIPLIRSLATMSWVHLGVQLGRLTMRLIRKHVHLPKVPVPVHVAP